MTKKVVKLIRFFVHYLNYGTRQLFCVKKRQRKKVVCERDRNKKTSV
jgi:hypothetical protein